MFGLKIAINAVDNTTGVMRSIDGSVKSFSRNLKSALKLGGLVYIFNQVGDAIGKAMETSKYAKDWDALRGRVSGIGKDIAATWANAVGPAFLGVLRIVEKTANVIKGAVNNARMLGTGIGSWIQGQGFETGINEERTRIAQEEAKKRALAVYAERDAARANEKEAKQSAKAEQDRSHEEMQKNWWNAQTPEQRKRYAIRQLSQPGMQKYSKEWQTATNELEKAQKEITDNFRNLGKMREDYAEELAKQVEDVADVLMNIGTSIKDQEQKQEDAGILLYTPQSRVGKSFLGGMPENFNVSQGSSALSQRIKRRGMGLRRPERRDWTAESFEGMSSEQLRELSIGPSSGILNAERAQKDAAKKQKKFDRLVRRGEFLQSKGVDISDMSPRVRAAMESKEAEKIEQKNLANDVRAIKEALIK